MEIQLIETNKDLKDIACGLIKDFWKEHNNIIQTDEDTESDFEEWTNEGHKLYLVKYDDVFIGFSHLASRGASINWLEDLYILKDYQNKGIGSQVICQLEDLVKTYSESLYIEVAARNLKAMKLYKNLGYDCLNTITIRKDFNEDDFEIIQMENIAGHEFRIKRYKK